MKMETNKENHFAHKFRLLNSQQCSADIIWSLSSSSDEEYLAGNKTFCNLSKGHRYTKRKRKKANNLSNLSITEVDSVPSRIDSKSPALRDETNFQKSPILKTKVIESSPILVPKSSQKSPILNQNSVKVKKKLFDKSYTGISSSIADNSEFIDTNVSVDKSSKSSGEIQCNFKVNNNISSKDTKNILYKKVKTFFDSNFGSDNASQNSISDVASPKDSLNSDEVEISSSTTECDSSSIGKLVSKFSSDDKCTIQSVKKMKYKKDGLAYRLNILMKKHSATHSLWQHEKFLASNSNFIMPKEENLIFRVKIVTCEYGCTTVNCVNENDQCYSIIINNCYITGKIRPDSVVKVYRPYKIYDLSHCKLVLNVCKYECLRMNV